MKVDLSKQHPVLWLHPMTYQQVNWLQSERTLHTTLNLPARKQNNNYQ